MLLFKIDLYKSPKDSTLHHKIHIKFHNLCIIIIRYGYIKGGRSWPHVRLASPSRCHWSTPSSSTQGTQPQGGTLDDNDEIMDANHSVRSDWVCFLQYPLKFFCYIDNFKIQDFK